MNAGVVLLAILLAIYLALAGFAVGVIVARVIRYRRGIAALRRSIEAHPSRGADR